LQSELALSVSFHSTETSCFEQPVSFSRSHWIGSEFHSTKLVSIRPRLSEFTVTRSLLRVPPNVKFQIDDVEADWAYPPNEPFDFIRLRAMGGSIANWPRLFKQAYDHLLPGGWIELSDFEAWASTDDGSLPEDSSYAEFQRRLDEASVKFGKKMNIAPHHKQALMDAGFHSVVEHIRKVSPSSSLTMAFIYERLG